MTLDFYSKLLVVCFDDVQMKTVGKGSKLHIF